MSEPITMTEIERAYRRGQEDMRRRIAARWRGYYVHGIGSAVAADSPLERVAKSASVPVLIRSTKIKPLTGSDHDGSR